MNFTDKLGKEILFFDGAMGTILQERGLQAGELPETWNLLKPEIIEQIHLEYLNSGADILKCNTFGASCFKLKDSGYSVNELVKSGIAIAKSAILKSCRDALCALDIGSLGKLMKPLGELAFDDAYEAFSEIVKAGPEADLILIETMSDTYEIKAAALAAKENSNLPIVVTMAFDEQGKLLTGGNIAAAVALLEGLRVDALGFNCGLGPKQMLKLLPELVQCCSLPIVVNPNAGLPVVENGETVFKVSPEEFAEDAVKLAQGGACVLGGCCGTTPAHIAKTRELCEKISIVKPCDKGLTVVSSYSRAVYFGGRPIIIGERINPTGKPRLKEALVKQDMDYLLKEGISQQENGADILDINVGMPEINEPEMLEKAVCSVQGVIDLPLQLDTSDVVAMERAMRVYNGKAMINSVNGKADVMKQVFELVKKYGGAVVCLTLDENGIPASIEGRVEIAEKIIQTAKKYGIDKKDLIVDALVMTVSTGVENAEITLGAMEKIRHELGVNTVLGVSNISFGLPMRENITSTFFTLAMSRGLSSGIVNPTSEKLMSAFYSFCVLSGHDNQCIGYINKYNNQANAAPPAKNAEMSLFDAILRGMIESAAKATKQLLLTRNSLEIIENELIPALDKVGDGFEKKTLFLPQLLMSADAAKASFEEIRAFMLKNDIKGESKGGVVLATVKGDIHDIGKNIVKVLLENYGFDVVDLGRDVPPETIVNVVLERKIKLVGLSALMTTTVVNMEKTIELLRRAAPNCKIMVGGAVLTQDYADAIGADFYSKDAMGSVRYAVRLSEHGDL